MVERGIPVEFNYFDLLTYGKKGYSRYLEPVCQQWNLTRNELDVVLFLANNPSLDRAADIVTHRGLAKSHVSLSVSTLEIKGLLRREMDPQDRRTVHLKLCNEAYQVAEAGRKAQQAFVERIHAGITPEEMALWRSIAQRIGEKLRNIEE